MNEFVVRRRRCVFIIIIIIIIIIVVHRAVLSQVFLARYLLWSTVSGTPQLVSAPMAKQEVKRRR